MQSFHQLTRLLLIQLGLFVFWPQYYWLLSEIVIEHFYADCKLWNSGLDDKGYWSVKYVAFKPKVSLHSVLTLSCVVHLSFCYDTFRLTQILQVYGQFPAQAYAAAEFFLEFDDWWYIKVSRQNKYKNAKIFKIPLALPFTFSWYTEFWDIRNTGQKKSNYFN